MKKLVVVSAILTCLIFAGCQNPQSCIVLTNQTGAGVVISYNSQTQIPDVKVGYVNSVFGIVPTNRAWADPEIEKVGGGAKDSANVLFETSFTNWLCFWSDHGIYQRVAVGDEAVKQPGAVAMFAKKDDGTIDTEAVKALANIVTTSKTVSALKTAIAKIFQGEKKDMLVAVIKELGYVSYDAFIDNENDESKINFVINKLKEKGIIVK